MLRFAKLAALLIGKDFGAGFITTAAPRGHDSDGGEGQFPGLRGRRGRAEGLQVLLQPRGEGVHALQHAVRAVRAQRRDVASGAVQAPEDTGVEAVK